jgi:hypothetical protein
MVILPARDRGICRRNGYFAGNYQFLYEEFAGGMVISPEITSLLTRNLPEEWLFRRKIPVPER